MHKNEAQTALMNRKKVPYGKTLRTDGRRMEPYRAIYAATADREKRQTAERPSNDVERNTMACQKRRGVGRPAGTVWTVENSVQPFLQMARRRAATEDIWSVKRWCGPWDLKHRFNKYSRPPAYGRGKKRALGSETNQEIGVSRGGKTTKIHAIVDGLGNPLYLQLSAGNVHDAKIATDVLDHVEIVESIVLGDKAYGTKKIREYILDRGGDYCIPPKVNNPDPWYCDWWIYKERHLVAMSLS